MNMTWEGEVFTVVNMITVLQSVMPCNCLNRTVLRWSYQVLLKCWHLMTYTASYHRRVQLYINELCKKLCQHEGLWLSVQNYHLLLSSASSVQHTPTQHMRFHQLCAVTIKKLLCGYCVPLQYMAALNILTSLLFAYRK